MIAQLSSVSQLLLVVTNHLNRAKLRMDQSKSIHLNQDTQRFVWEIMKKSWVWSDFLNSN